jgi:chromosomal replication initiation ATPase DnaA
VRLLGLELLAHYREGIDVLLIDDVQFLAGKESMQVARQ